MGWERKRGKLDELNACCEATRRPSFTTIEGRLPHDVKYVLTLDSDTASPEVRPVDTHRQARSPIEPAVWDPERARLTAASASSSPESPRRCR